MMPFDRLSRRDFQETSGDFYQIELGRKLDARFQSLQASDPAVTPDQKLAAADMLHRRVMRRIAIYRAHEQTRNSLQEREHLRGLAADSFREKLGHLLAGRRPDTPWLDAPANTRPNSIRELAGLQTDRALTPGQLQSFIQQFQDLQCRAFEESYDQQVGELRDTLDKIPPLKDQALREFKTVVQKAQRDIDDIEHGRGAIGFDLSGSAEKKRDRIDKRKEEARQELNQLLRKLTAQLAELHTRPSSHGLQDEIRQLSERITALHAAAVDVISRGKPNIDEELKALREYPIEKAVIQNRYQAHKEELSKRFREHLRKSERYQAAVATLAADAGARDPDKLLKLSQELASDFYFAQKKEADKFWRDVKKQADAKAGECYQKLAKEVKTYHGQNLPPTEGSQAGVVHMGQGDYVDPVDEYFKKDKDWRFTDSSNYDVRITKDEGSGLRFSFKVPRTECSSLVPLGGMATMPLLMSIATVGVPAAVAFSPLLVAAGIVGVGAGITAGVMKGIDAYRNREFTQAFDQAAMTYAGLLAAERAEHADDYDDWEDEMEVYIGIPARATDKEKQYAARLAATLNQVKGVTVCSSVKTEIPAEKSRWGKVKSLSSKPESSGYHEAMVKATKEKRVQANRVDSRLPQEEAALRSQEEALKQQKKKLGEDDTPQPPLSITPRG